MRDQNAVIGWTGIAAGTISLMLALVHFYAGPFSTQPTLEQSVADRVVALREATIAALKGEEAEPKQDRSRFDADQLAQIAVAVLGGLAIVLAVIGFARKEPSRVAIGAAGLGATAITFQFLTLLLGAILFVVLVAAVLGSFGFDLSDA